MVHLLLTLVLLAAFGCTRELDQPAANLFVEETEVPQRPIKYLALGDSYTIGESVAEADRWPNVLARALEARGMAVDTTRIIARTGWRTDNLLNGIAAEKPSHDQDLVSLLIGVNNEYQHRPIDEYRAQFQQCLDTAIALAGGNRAKVFVVSIPDYGYMPYGQGNQASISARIDQFNAVNKEITASYGMAYFDITPASRQWRDDFVAPDGLHPSGIQYAAWVKVMEAGVATMLGK